MTIDRTTPANALPEWLRVDEVADWLDVGKAVIYAMCASGELRAVKLGRVLRVPRAALLAMVDGQQSERDS